MNRAPPRRKGRHRTPDGSGFAIDLGPDALSAGFAEALPERAALEAGDWSNYWRLTPWFAGLAAALAGAELARCRRAAADAARAGALAALDALCDLPGLRPGEDG